ncbi:winged helix DNA-binding domain-containing protein [Spirosoma sp. KCTC 42546]|uniref:winged helix DNA-binding domain-containing protein n=1 Tax=Spirosoma sp. KCTC 42546 TaxID=2520506 RepID=UPI00115BF5DD|nr:winged helix DNA-binding domain-containing protein [Spirosoma sp. KCTC 42546]QDK81747.1 winged helix DNA-binding domain-containing protein [Spirosoma sp. KCTC 42546]
MSDPILVQNRLIHQQLVQPLFTRPSDVVGWFGAMQAQDYAAAKWAVGLRLPRVTDAAIEQAIADKSIIRTWALRGTLHFVAAEDIRWVLALVRHRLRLICGTHYRKLNLDDNVLEKSKEVIALALAGGQQLTRPELKLALDRAGILTHDLRLNFLLGNAAFDGLICFGNRREKEFTFTLLDEWAPGTKALERDEAVATLTRRYFTSHGPATLSDFVWWSGLTSTEAKEGLQLAKAALVSETMHGQTYWMASATSSLQNLSPLVHLLPSFDEYLVAYKDRSAALGTLEFSQIVSAGNGIFSPVVVVDGQVAGTWKRTLKKDTVSIETSLFFPLSEEQLQAVSVAGSQYRAFLGFY